MSTGWRKPFGYTEEQWAQRTSAAHYVDESPETAESFEEAFRELCGEPLDCDTLSDSLSLSRVEGHRLEALTRTRLTQMLWALDRQREERAALREAKLPGRKESLDDLIKRESKAAAWGGHRGIQYIATTKTAMHLLEKHEETGRELVEFLRRHEDEDADAPGPAARMEIESLKEDSDESAAPAGRARRVPDEVGDRVVAFLAAWIHEHAGAWHWGYVARAMERYGHVRFAGEGGAKRAQLVVQRWNKRHEPPAS